MSKDAREDGFAAEAVTPVGTTRLSALDQLVGTLREQGEPPA